MMKSVIACVSVTVAALALSSPAFAECDGKQEKDVGRAVAHKAASYIPSGEQGGVRSIDLDVCEGGSTYFRTKFRYHVEREGQPHWIVEGEARGKDADVREIRIKRSEPVTRRQYARADTW